MTTVGQDVRSVEDVKNITKGAGSWMRASSYARCTNTPRTSSQIATDTNTVAVEAVAEAKVSKEATNATTTVTHQTKTQGREMIAQTQETGVR